MPEGPEVRLTTEYLNDVLSDRSITRWGFVDGRYTDDPPVGYEEFDGSLPMMVESVQCKGKFIYFTFYNENGYMYLIHSLMMTGRWQEEYDEQCKCFVEIDDGTTLWFRDSRSLGTMKFTTDESVLEEKLNYLGPDILTEQFTLPKFKSLQKKYGNRNITSFLMDQRVISGCGNYIKAEVLYYARISPLRKVSSLTQAETELLFEAMRIIPRLSYNFKGLSMSDYAEHNGQPGNPSQNLKIYGSKNARRTSTPDGRITYWDPNIQK